MIEVVLDMEFGGLIKHDSAQDFLVPFISDVKMVNQTSQLHIAHNPDYPCCCCLPTSIALSKKSSYRPEFAKASTIILEYYD